MGKKSANGEGSIFQRKRDGKWVCEIVIGWTPEGKKQILRHAADSRREVADWRAKKLTERQTGMLTEPSRQTVGQYLQHWLDTTACHEVKPRTLADYRDLVGRYVLPEIGQVELQKLSPMQVQALYHRRLQSGLSPRSVQLIHAVLRRGLQQAVEWQLLARNPADAAKKPRVERKQMQALDPEQVIRFLEAAKQDRLHALLTLAVTTGLRQGELLGLRWSDVDLSQATLTVSQTLSWIENKPFFGTPKTKASRRTVDLPAVAVSSLRQWRREQAEERLKVGSCWMHPDLVFTTPIGTPICPSNLRSNSFARVLKRAECPRIRFHDLRHTAATLMLSQGVQARVLQDVLGHSDIRMTLGTYSHVLREQKQEAARKVDTFLAAAQKTVR